jgi:hypothetical protein
LRSSRTCQANLYANSSRKIRASRSASWRFGFGGHSLVSATASRVTLPRLAHRISVIPKRMPIRPRKGRRRKRGRPATGRDPVIPVRLPKRTLRGLTLFAQAYPGMSRSVAIRCVIELGLARAAYYVVDPKSKIAYEGATPVLSKFLGRATLKWSKRKPNREPRDWGPPVNYKAGRRSRPLTPDEINAAVERAMTRSTAAGR